MMRTSLKKFWLFLISAMLVATAAVLACAGGDWEGTEGSMFAPEIINQPKFSSFFRTTATPFYDGYDDQSGDYFKEENNKDWFSYFGKKLSREGVHYWLYDATLNQVDSMIFQIKNKPSNLTEKSKTYTMECVERDKAIAFLYYLGYAKRNETFASVHYNYWEQEAESKKESVSVEKQISGGINFLKNAKDPFMKERYAFQLLRTYFFAKEYDKVILTFTENEKYFVSENNLKWRAFSYKAGAFYKQKEFAQANYLFSKVYEGCDILKKSSFLCFHPQQQGDWNACLAMAKTTKEKEVLWQLFGLHSDPVLAMKEILKLNPKSEYADLLLVRAVNMEEEKFEGNLTTGTLSNEKSKNSVDESFVSLLNEVSSSNSTDNPAAWHLSAAYMNYIKRDYETADKQLSRARQSIKGNDLLTAQCHLISLIGKIGRIGEMNSSIEASLVPDLKIILESKDSISDFRIQYALGWMRETLAKYAQRKGEMEKAELINPGSTKLPFNKIETIEKMISYYEKVRPSEYEKLFFKYALLGKYDYLELKAIRLTHQDKLEEALAVFKSQSSPADYLPGNPFTIHIKDCHDCDHEALQKVKYSRIAFLEKMIEMKKIAKEKPAEASTNYFLVANGFYNITNFGNARQFYGYNRVDAGFYYYGDETCPEEKTDLALNYYLLAKQNSKDKEFRAKCTFMTAKCELNSSYTTMDPENIKDDYIANKNFSLLRKEFSDTKYYKEVIKECGYFRTYLGMK